MNKTSYINLDKFENPDAQSHTIFTPKEIDKLWSVESSNPYFKIVLILIYTGVRIAELLDLKKENVNLEKQYFDVIDSKTENGIRKVPIANKVLPFFKYWYNLNDSEFLLSTPDQKHFLYRNYYDSYWKPLMEQLKMQEHRPHDTRHTCISLLAEAHVDSVMIKTIVGHSGAMSLTEKVYTHIDISKLLEAINKI